MSLACSDKAGEHLQNIIKLEVKAGDGTLLFPPPYSDPLNRTNLQWTQSNVAKIVHYLPPSSPPEILLTVETSDPTAKFAVVWTTV